MVLGRARESGGLQAETMASRLPRRRLDQLLGCLGEHRRAIELSHDHGAVTHHGLPGQ